LTLAVEFAAAAACMNVTTIRAQNLAAPTSKFEVASIKLCRAGDMPAGGGRSGGGASGNDPGRLRLECQNLDRLVRLAYIQFADGKDWFPGGPGPSRRQINQPVAGEPPWANSDRYTIDAEPQTPQTAGMMHGPMLQSLLEERFRLKLHRDRRDVPVYALVVGKGGPRLTASTEESCRPLDLASDLPAPPRPGEPPLCELFRPDKNGGTQTLGQTLGGLCRQFSVALDRDVVDRTGIAGKFDIRLEVSEDDLFPFARQNRASDAAASALPDDPLSAIMAAVQKLGLKLEPAKATAEFLVIDRVERPSEN
jgi:uncharacterized protein (TIGR03435 family)